jgi:hypothetical protein
VTGEVTHAYHIAESSAAAIFTSSTGRGKSVTVVVVNPLRNDALTYLGRTTYRNQRRLFGIRQADRRQHIYSIGQTGTGKSTLLHAVMRQDLVAGRGFALIDPHGDLVDRVFESLPDDLRGRPLLQRKRRLRAIASLERRTSSTVADQRGQIMRTTFSAAPSESM